MLDGAGSQSTVDAVHNPAEELGVDVFGQRVPAADGAPRRHRFNTSVHGRLELGVT